MSDEAAVPTPNNAKSVGMGCVVVIVLVGLVLAAVMALSGPAGAVSKVLGDWKRGNSSGEHWLNGVELQRLYNVSEYKHLRTEDQGSRALVSFRVKSTMQIGFPIEQQWDFIVVKTDKGWLVAEMIEPTP